MMRLSTLYSNANTPLSIKNNGLVWYQSKAPVHWGVNATLAGQLKIRAASKAPVHWGVNATSYRGQSNRLSSKAPVHWGVNATHQSPSPLR